MPTTTPLLYPLPLPSSTLTSPPPTLSLTPTFNPTTTGTALWPSARLLSTHLLSLRPRDRRPRGPLSKSHHGTGQRGSRPLRILDLGSGLGLVAMVCASGLGAQVVATDLGVVVPGLQENAAANQRVIDAAGGSVEAKVLDWVDALREEEKTGGGSDGAFEREDRGGDVAGQVEIVSDGVGGENLVGEEFDWITTSDTLYHEPLIPGLLATIDRYASQKTILWMAFERRDAQVEERARESLKRRGWRGRRVRAGKKMEKDEENDEPEETGQEGGGKTGKDENGEHDEDEDGDEGLEDCEVWRWERVKVRKDKGKADEGRKRKGSLLKADDVEVIKT